MISYLRVTTLAATQHGAFNRRQALERGMTSTMLTKRVRNGSLTSPYEAPSSSLDQQRHGNVWQRLRY
ncbi:MAG: type IV toxin-antitoxin system AbiEi family antitoxin domain-containing protein [Acidimicrobiia bacterium]